MKTKKTVALIVALSSAFTLMLAGCTPNEGGPGNVATPTPKPYGEKYVEMWWEDTNTKVVPAQAIYDFEKAYSEQYPGILIEATTPTIPSGTNAITLLINNLAGSIAPDIVSIDHVYIPNLGMNGQIQDLMDYNVEELKPNYIQAAWDGVTFQKDGQPHIYGLPWVINAGAVQWYNKALLQEANVNEAPKTYEDMLKTAQAIKALNQQDVYGFAFPFAADSTNYEAFSFCFWLWRLGGDVLNEDYTEATFNSPEGVEALQRIVYMQQQGLVATTDMQTQVPSGKVGFAEYYSGAVTSTLADDNNHETVGASVLPTLKEGIPNYSGIGVWTFALVNNHVKENDQLAYDFMKFLCTTPQYQDDLNQLAKGQSSSLLEGNTNEMFQRDEWKVVFEQLDESKSRPLVPYWKNIEEAIAFAIDQSATQGTPPQETLNAAAQKVNKIVKDYNEKGDVPAWDE